MQYYTLFFRKLGEMLQNLLSTAVVIAALRVNEVLTEYSVIEEVVDEAKLFSLFSDERHAMC